MFLPIISVVLFLLLSVSFDVGIGIGIGIGIVNGAVNPRAPSSARNGNVQGKRLEELDPRYTVEWEPDFESKSVEFLVRVQTTGFVGFGLSVAGTMNGGDIVIGGVNPNGTKYFAHYHGTGNVPPVLDEKQNWELLDGSEENGVTTLRFKRLMETCDEDDVEITAGTLKLIWAIGATDTIGPHTPTNRGALAVNMLDPPFPPVELEDFDKEIVPMHYELTPDDTVYWCTVHKRVPENGKSHIVAFKPILDTPEARKHTHHFSLYTCKSPNPEEDLEPFVGKGMDCDLSPRRVCQGNLYAWSFGGRLLMFPENIGFPWGTDETEYFLFEVHFDNPELESGKMVETGVEVYHTQDFREHEAGMLMMGHLTSPTLMIPPRTDDWTLVGHCSSTCTAEGIPLATPAIKMFNANLHAHKSGRKMKLRHFRSGQERPWVANDYTYDFDFQENRPFREEVELLPGDHLSIECTFDSNWYAPNAIIGGPSTRDEMCMVFIFYYPKVPLEACFSGYSTDKLLTRLGIEEFVNGYDPVIVKPEKWAGLTFTQFLANNVSWSDPMKAELLEELRFGMHDELCHNVEMPKLGLDGVPLPGLQNLPQIGYPEFEKEYEEDKADCNTDEETTTTPGDEPDPETTTLDGGDGSNSNALSGKLIFNATGLLILILFRLTLTL